jgi:hypothetical protein
VFASRGEPAAVEAFAGVGHVVGFPMGMIIIVTLRLARRHHT